MAVDWKGSLPLIVLLLAVAALSFAKADISVNSFVGIVIVAAVWLLVIPLLNAAGVAKVANSWFIRAGITALLAAAFTLVPTLVNIGNWVAVVTDIGLILSWFMAFIGTLVAFFSVR